MSSFRLDSLPLTVSPDSHTINTKDLTCTLWVCSCFAAWCVCVKSKRSLSLLLASHPLLQHPQSPCQCPTNVTATDLQQIHWSQSKMGIKLLFLLVKGPPISSWLNCFIYAQPQSWFFQLQHPEQEHSWNLQTKSWKKTNVPEPSLFSRYHLTSWKIEMGIVFSFSLQL